MPVTKSKISDIICLYISEVIFNLNVSDKEGVDYEKAGVGTADGR